jgi:protein-tyrosine phosphatase
MKDVSKLDFHNHLIPGVDDGAATVDDGVAGIATMAAQGIRHIVATPHLRASLVARTTDCASYLGDVGVAWQRLLDSAAPMEGINIYRGFEILLDVPSVDLSDPLLRLAGSKFVLVEFPFVSIPPHSETALFNIKIQECEPIVAHPERYAGIQEDPLRAKEWLRVGAHLQANAGSFIGQYGRAAERTVWTLLELGLLAYVCSDFHAVGACQTEPAYKAIEKRYGPDVPRRLFSDNPLGILKNETPLRVQPPPRRGILGWLRSRLRP